MKQILFVCMLLTASTVAFSQTTTIFVSTKGMGPIPYFMRSGAVGFVSHNTKIAKHLEVSPDVAFSLQNGKLWFTDLWWRGNFFLDTAKKLLLTAGIDFPSYFGQTYMDDNGKKIDQFTIYPAGQLRLKYFPKENAVIIVDYWYMHVNEMKYGVKGSYLSCALSWSKELTKKVTLNANPNVFFLNFSDGTSGTASSLALSLEHESGVFLTLQGLTKITVRSLKPTGNISVGITRKLF